MTCSDPSRGTDERARRGRWASALLLTFAVLTGLAVTIAPAQASVMCMPEAEVASCLASTMGSRAAPVAGVDVTLTAPDGSEETVTTGEDGRWGFRITETGTYTVSIDPETLPQDIEATQTTKQVEVPQLGQTVGLNLQVRSVDYDATVSKVDQVLQNAVNGLRLGLLLAMASLGLSLIYGTTGLSNFAHAELVTLGGVLGYFLIAPSKLGLGLVVGGIIVVVLCGALGWVQDRFMWQPLRRRGLGLTQAMIVTIGISLAAQYVFQYAIGAGTVKLVGGGGDAFNVGPIVLTHRSLIAMVIAIVMIGAVGYFLLFTRVGRATRAVSDNPALAAASGIDPDRVIRLVWTMAGALAGLSGLLYALTVQSGGIKWDSGMQILLLLFAAVTLGGLGTAFGALVGSLIIGMIVELAGVAGIPGNLKYAVALVILILLLMVRPQGLLGKAQRVG